MSDESPDPQPVSALAADVALQLETLLEAVGEGALDAPPGFVTRLEGALIALRAIEEGA